MIKKYKCSSNISFNIILDGRRKRISFDAHTQGGSEYLTTDKKVQEAIEGMPFFGSQITLAEKSEAKKESISTQEDSDESIDLIPVEGIANCADAKAYLFEKGITVTLRSKDQIHNVARELGICFVDLK